MSTNEEQAQRFRRLMEASGLAQLIHSYRTLGYRFAITLPGCEPLQTVFTPTSDPKAVWFAMNDLDISEWPEMPTFISIIMHEIGHIEALERGLDSSDENLAWILAEELIPIPLPHEWEDLKKAALKTYASREAGIPLTPDELSTLTFDNLCPTCNSSHLENSPESLGVGPNQPGIELIHCKACEAQFQVIWQRAGAQSGYHWVLVSSE